jgi:RES domain-containing protein
LTIRAWRIVSRNHVATAFDGEAAKNAGGRWNSPGSAVVYAAPTLPFAALELLVHLPRESILAKFVSIPVDFDEGLITRLTRSLPPDWRDYPAPFSTMTIGDEWLRSKASPVLCVPSVIIPNESNFLVDPAHADFAKLSIGTPEDFWFDPRLIK